MIQATPALRLALCIATPLLVMTGVRHTLERFWPAHLKRTRLHGVALAAWAATMVGDALSGPALGGVVTAAINRAHGGLVVLPEHGAGWWLSLLVYFVAMDFGEWAFHRAQHAVPALWTMHALHHSDRAFDSTTAARHFWLEPAIKTVTIWLAVGVLFRTPSSVAAVYVAVGFYHYVIHSNTRIDFGRWAWVLNAPGYHRLHHSRASEHFDVNFASLFPIFDVLTGAYRPPRPGERIQTGLDTGEEPRDVLDVLVWPVRRLRQARIASPASA